MGKVQHKLFGLLLLLLILTSGASFVFAERQLEAQYPQISGETPTIKSLPQYVKYIFNFSVGIASFVAFASLIYGGVRYLTSAGNTTSMRAARSQIFAGILGLVILLSSYVLLSVINPQLLFLKIDLPELGEVPPTTPPEIPSGLQTLTATEIPIATLVNGAGYSEHKGVLDERRMAAIKEILDEVKKASFKIIEYSEELNLLAAGCSGDNTICVLEGSCTCEGDPCPQRQKMNETRLKINALNMAIDIFIKKDEKIRDYMENFPSLALLQKSVTWAESEGCNSQAGVACSGAGWAGCAASARRSCLMGSFGASTALPSDLQKNLERMAEIEEEGGELEQIKEEMAQDLQFLTEGEKKMRECPGVNEDRRSYDLLPANEFSVYEEDLVYGVKLVKEIKVESAWPEITTMDDPGTFYCAEGLNEIPFMKEAFTEEQIETELQKTSQDQATQEVTCETEIPLGKTINDATALAQKIMEAINELMDSSSNQVASAFQITSLTNWESGHCGASMRISLGSEMGSAAFCPAVACPTSGAGKPCAPVPTCPLNDINSALENVKKDVACFLKKEGQTGIEYGRESLTCCRDPYNFSSCRETEGPYGRLLKYYEESVELNKQLADDRNSLSVCKNTAEERTQIMLGKNIPEKGVATCLIAKSSCSNLEEEYECYGNENPDALSNYFCITAETQ